LALKQIESDSSDLAHKTPKACQESLELLKQSIQTNKQKLNGLDSGILNNNKVISISQSQIKEAETTKSNIKNIKTCPLCQSDMTPEHVNHVMLNSDTKIKQASLTTKSAETTLSELTKQKTELTNTLASLDNNISSSEVELIKHNNINEKRSQLKKFLDEEQLIKSEIQTLEERRKSLESNVPNLIKIEERYDSKILEIEEVSSRTEDNVNDSIMFKERELEGMKNIIKTSSSDLEDVDLYISEISENFDSKIAELEQNEIQEQELNAKFKKLFAERDTLQKTIQERSLALSETQNATRQIEDQINYLKVGKAKLDAEAEAIQMELSEYQDVDPLKGTLEAIQDRLQRSQNALNQIGSINMRALEVYDEVKKGYDEIQSKVDIITNEKQGIMDIIAEIDKKKKREFMKTFRAINTLFTENFSKLYTKGIAYLEPQNKENLFDGGIDIVVKLAKGKYFDVTSLSGGEQTLVALALLFAIQEHKPYHFYVFDEIDAALDKRNSERLAGLLKKYMKSGQYIVVTHNDAIITESDYLYGVSMHEGVSKVLSLKI